MLVSKLSYYLSSIPTLFGHVHLLPIAIGKAIFTKDSQVIQLRGGMQFRVRSLMDIWVLKETCLDRDYQKASIEIEDGWTVLDIGAGLGDFAVSVAKANPRSRVLAYEPFPSSYSLLLENAKLNGVRNIEPHAVAIGSSDGTLSLQLTGAAVQHSTASTSASSDSTRIEVQSILLARALADVETCHYLKADCEGAEYDILMHAPADTLRKIRHICLEYHDGVTRFSHVDLAKFLEAHRFVVTTTVNPVHADLGFLYARNTASSEGRL